MRKDFVSTMYRIMKKGYDMYEACVIANRIYDSYDPKKDDLWIIVENLPRA